METEAVSTQTNMCDWFLTYFKHNLSVSGTEKRTTGMMKTVMTPLNNHLLYKALEYPDQSNQNSYQANCFHTVSFKLFSEVMNLLQIKTV